MVVFFIENLELFMIIECYLLLKGWIVGLVGYSGVGVGWVGGVGGGNKKQKSTYQFYISPMMMIIR